MAYDLPPATGPCPACAAVATDAVVFVRRPGAVAYVPGKQRGEGSAFVVPVRHAVSLSDLELHEVDDLWAAVAAAQVALVETYDVDGISLGQYTGVLADSSMAHLHVTLDPRVDGEPGDFSPLARLPDVTLADRLAQADRLRVAGGGWRSTADP